jgi:hypothetical protein
MGCSHSKAVPPPPAYKSSDATHPSFKSSMQHSGMYAGLRYNMVKQKHVALEDLYQVHERTDSITMQTDSNTQQILVFVPFLQVFDEELGAAAMGCVVRKAMRRTTKEFFAVKTFNMGTVPDPKVQKKVSGVSNLYTTTDCCAARCLYYREEHVHDASRTRCRLRLSNAALFSMYMF